MSEAENSEYLLMLDLTTYFHYRWHCRAADSARSRVNITFGIRPGETLALSVKTAVAKQRRAVQLSIRKVDQ